MRALRVLAIGLLLCAVIVGLRWWLHREQQAADGNDHEPNPGPRAAVTAVGEEFPRPLQIGEEVPDAALVDQNGREFRLSDWRGRPFVLSFLYTNCNLPSMCPLTAARLADVHQQLRGKGDDVVRFLVVSFDPEHDRPEQLRRYGASHGISGPGFRFATGTPGEIARLSHAFNTYYREGESGVFDHNIVVSLIDGEGVLRREFFGTSWTAGELLAAIESL